MSTAEHAVSSMCEFMTPRGPDDAGLEVIDEGPVIGSRRLAIIDLSPLGHQPMRDERGNVIAFNGMIYNYRELRRELMAAGERFTSDCDTEVVLRGFGVWGTDVLRRLRGMFAFAIWDVRARRIFLARDRLGIKPLYVHVRGKKFMFASTVRALLASGEVAFRLNRDAVAQFLSFGAVSDPDAIVEGIQAIDAGECAVWDGTVLSRWRYWEPPANPSLDLDRNESSRELRTLLEDAVERHLLSDAPAGVFLSGGLDSSVVAALAARARAHLRTVSVSFAEREFSERPFQERVAKAIGSEHISVQLTADETLGMVDAFFAGMDQPTFDGLNTYVVSGGASRAGLTVALSGLGADELMNGYGYAWRAQVLRAARHAPAPLRAAVAVGVRAIAKGSSQRDKTAAWLAGEVGNERAYELLRRLFLPEQVRRLVGTSTRTELHDGAGAHGLALLDLNNYMKNVLLRDTDAMSMAHSLEVRVPYLDDEVVDFVLRLPDSVKAEPGKALLTRAAADLIPEEVLRRRKHGFLLPVREWMRGPLRSEVASRLRNPPPEVAEIVDAAEMRRLGEGFEYGSAWLRPWSLYALSRWVESVTGKDHDGMAQPLETGRANAKARKRGISIAVLRDPPVERRLSMERYADALARELRSAGYDVGEFALQIPGGIRIGRFGGYYDRWVRAVVSAARLDADIYHVIDQGYGQLAALLPKDRTVITCHDLMVLRSLRSMVGFRAARKTSVRYRWSTSYLGKVAHVICDSEATRGDVIDLVGADPTRLSVVPLGIDPHFKRLPAEERARLREELGVEDRLVVLNVSTGSPYKNHEGVLETVARLRDQGEDAILLRSGRVYGPEMAALARDLGLDPYLHQQGIVPERRLVELLNLADVLLHPSYWEGFGWPPLEAMACGTPVVASTAAAIVETVQGAGIVCEPDDIDGLAEGVVRVARGPERDAFIEKGLIRASEYTWERTAAEVARIYTDVLGRV